MSDVSRATFRGYHRHSLVNLAASLLLSTLTLSSAWAGPEGGVIRRGEGHITRPNAQRTDVHQHTQRMVVDWQSFNVAGNEQVNFLQPNSDAAVLNRIFDQNPSQIFGQINANGRVLLSNANGIVFGESAAVNVGSLIASGLNVDADAFMNGQLSLHADHPGLVVNHGLVHAANGGFVGMIGGAVENSGVIIANYGSIELAAGRTATVDFDGDGLIRFAVSRDVLGNAAGVESAVSNTGTLRADAGVIAMSGHVANEIFSQVVNNEGVIAARGVSSDGGRVFLSGPGGDVVNSGVIDVSSDANRGGRVEVTGERVGLFGNAVIDASGASGGDVLVGGDYQGKGNVATAGMTVMGPGAVIDASATDGLGGKVILWADGYTRFNGTIDASGPTGGFVETSGKQSLDATGTVLAREWLLDPRNVTIADPTGGDDTSNGSFGGGNPDTFTPSGDDAMVDVNTIIASLNNGTSVIITTADATGTQDGDITVNAAISTTTSSLATLTLLADGDILVNNGILDNFGAGLNVVFNAGGDVLLNGSIGTNGGDFSSIGNLFTLSSGRQIITNSGNVDIVHSGAVSIAGEVSAAAAGGGGSIAISGTSVGFTSPGAGVNITTSDADISVTATAGDITDTNGDVGGTYNIGLSGVGLLTLSASGDVGGTTGSDDIDTATLQLAIVSGGDVGIANDTLIFGVGVTLTDLSLTLDPSVNPNYDITSDSTSINLSETGGDLVINGISNSGNALNLTVTTSSGGILLDDGAITNIGSGTVSLAAFGAIEDNDGGVASGIDTTGAVTLTAGAAIGANGAVETSGTTALTASANGVLDIAHAATADTAVTLASTDDITFNQSGGLLLDVVSLNAGTGAVDIDNNATVNVQSLTTSGDVDIDATGATSDITLGANAISATGATVSLSAGQNITGTGTANITAQALAASAGNDVILDTSISMVAGSAAGNEFTVTNASALDVGAVDGINGINSNNIARLTVAGDLTTSQRISAVNVILDQSAAGNMGSSVSPVLLAVNNGVMVVRSEGDVFIEGNGGSMTLNLFSTRANSADTVEITNLNGNIGFLDDLLDGDLVGDSITLTSGGRISMDDVDVGTTGVLNLFADNINFSSTAALNSTVGGGITMAPLTAGTTIGLGSGGATGTWTINGSTYFAGADIQAITTAGGGTLSIGSGSAGNISLDSISLLSNHILNLVTGGDLVDADGGLSIVPASGQTNISLTVTAGGNIGSAADEIRLFVDYLEFNAGGSVDLSGDVAAIDNSSAGGLVRYQGNGPGVSLVLGDISATGGTDSDGIEISGVGVIELDGNVQASGLGDVVFSNIVSINDVDGNGLVSSDSLRIVVNDGSIGSALQPINTNVNTLVATPDTVDDTLAGIHISEFDDIVIDNLVASSGVVAITAGGAITATSLINNGLTDADDISLAGVGIQVGTDATNGILASGPGDVLLDAGSGSISGPGTVGGDVVALGATSGITVNTAAAALTVDNTASGDIDITEADAVSLLTTARNQAVGGGLSIVTINGDINTGSVAVTTEGGDIVLTGGVSSALSTAQVIIGSGGVASGSDGALDGGDITISAADNVSFAGTVDATGTNSTGDVTLRANFLDTDVTGSVSGAGLVTANHLTVTAASGIDVTTAAVILTADNTDSNDVTIHELDDISFDTQVRNRGTDALRVETTDGSIDTGSAAVTTAGGSLALIAGDAGSNSNRTLTIGIGGIDSAFDGALATAGGGFVTLTGADGIAIAGTVNAVGTNPVAAGSIDINADLGDATSDDTGAISQTAGVINANRLRLSAAGNIGSGANRLSGNVNVLGASSTVAGDIYFSNNGDLQLGDGIVGGISTADGLVDIAANGAVSDDTSAGVDNMILAGGTGGITIVSNGSMALTDTVSTNDGAIHLAANDPTAGADGNVTLTVNGDVTAGAGRNITIESADDIVLGGNIASPGAGDITIVADDDANSRDAFGDGNGAITRTAGIVSGNILTLSAAENIGAATPGQELATDALVLVASSTVAGGIYVNSVANLMQLGSTTDGISTADGDIVITAARDLDTAGGLAGDVISAGGTGSITLDVANGSITIDDSLATNNGAVTLRANDNGVAGNIAINADLVAGGGNDIIIQAADDVALAGNVNAGAGGITVIADDDANSRDILVADTEGAITQVSGTLTGSVVSLSASEGIGANGSAINTSAALLDAVVTSTGDIYIAENDDVALTVVNTVNGLIDIHSNGTITATDVFSGTDSENNDITLHAAAGDIIIGNVRVAGGAAADITLIADAGAITDGTTSDLVAETLTLTARDGIGSSGNRINTLTDVLVADVTGAGDLYLSDTSVDGLVLGDALNAINVFDGNVDIIASDDIHLAAGIVSNDDNGSGDDLVKLVSINASISDFNDDQVTDIVAPNIELVAINGSIGGILPLGAADKAIELDGSFTVNAGNDVALADVTGSTGTITLDVTAGGGFSFSRTGDILIDQITAMGDVSLTSTGGSINDLQDDNIADIVIGAGALSRVVSLTAADEIGGAPGAGTTAGENRGAIEISGADVINATAATSSAATTGDIVLSSADAVTLANLGTDDGDIDVLVSGDAETDLLTASGNVALNATGAIVDNNGTLSAITAGMVTLIAQNGIGAAGRRIRTSATSLNASVGATGDLYIIENDGLTLTAVDTADGLIDIQANGTIMAADVLSGTDNDNNDITLHSTSGDIVIGDVRINGGTAGDITLIADAGAITDATNALVAQEITLIAASGIGASGNAIDTAAVSLQASVTAAGGLHVAETDGITLADIGAANGAIDIQANGTIMATDVLSGTDNESNDITLHATSGNIVIDNVRINGGTAGDITLIADTGAITDDANTLVAQHITLTAASGIGATGNAIDITATSLDASVTAAGDLHVIETGSIELADIDTADGLINIQANGTITATDVLSGTDNDNNDILLRATAGNIAIGNVRVGGGATAGDISLAADAGSIIQGAANDLAAQHVSLAARDGIGSSGTRLRTAAGSIDASVSGAGDVFIDEADAVTLADVDTADGRIDVRANGTITATDVLSSTNDDANDIVLQATTGNIAIGSIRINGGTAGDVTLAANNGAITHTTANAIVADVLTMSSGNGIGMATGNIATAVNTIVADVTGAGDLYIADTSADGVRLGDAVNDISVFDGDIGITASGDIYIGSVVANDNGGSGDDRVKLVSLNASINDAADDAIMDIAAPNIELTANNGSIGGSPLPGTTNDPDDPVGAIELAGNFTISANGDIAIADKSGAGSTIVGMTSTTGDIAFTFDNDIYIDAITASNGNVTLISNNGSIFDQQDDELTDITVGAGRFVDLRAGGAIGGESLGDTAPNDARIEVAADIVRADADGGDILLYVAGPATLANVDAIAGAIDIAADDAVEIDIVSAAGDITLDAGGAITDRNATPGLLSGSTVTLVAAAGIGTASNGINTSAANLALATGAGGVFINETDGVVIDGIGNAGGAIELAAGGVIQLGADLATTGNTLILDGAVALTGDVTLSSGGGELKVTGTVTGNANDLTVSSGAGRVSLASVTDVGTFRRNGSGALTVSGDISAATVDINSGVQLAAGSDITAAIGGIAISGGLTLSGSGSATTLATTGDGNVSVGGAISGSRGLVVDSEGSVTLGAVSLAGRSVRLTVDADNDAVGTLDAAEISAASITLSGGGNDDVFDFSNANASGDFALQTGGTIADGVSINAGGDIDLDGSYQVGDLVLEAGNITVAGTLDSTAVGGSVAIANSGTLSLGGHVLLDGAFTQTGDAVALAGDIQASEGISLAGELQLGASSHAISTGSGAGNIALDGGVDGNGADLALDAGSGSITLAGATEIGDLALSGDGLALAADIAVTTLDVSGMQGALSLLADTAISTDEGDVSFGGFASIDSVAGQSSALAIDAGAGDILLRGVVIGAGERLARIDLDGASISLDDVATVGDQDYSGDVLLAGTLDSASGDVLLDGDVALDANSRIDAGASVAVNGDIEGGRSLAIDANQAVIVHGDIGAGSPLQNLVLSASSIELNTVTTTGTQTYSGAVRVRGDLAGRELAFNGSLFLPSGAVFTADAIDFNGGNGSVRGNGELSLVPATDGATINLGGNGADLDLSNTALNGYDGGLVIGGTLSDSSATIVASTIAVNGDLDVGDGYLVLLSRDNVTMHSGELAGSQLTIVASDENGTIVNAGGTNTVLTGQEIVLVAGGTIGEEGKDVRARGNGSGATLQVASGASQASIDTGGTLQEETGTNAIIAIAIADLLGLRTNTDLQVTSSAQSSANREQSGGLTEEGFIDASLFEEIALYETAGTGILLPLDQSEEMPEEGCGVTEEGRTECGERAVGVAINGAPR